MDADPSNMPDMRLTTSSTGSMNTKADYLEKKSDFLGLWNQRFVRLSENGVLSWYVNEQSESPKGSTPLVNAEIFTQDVDDNGVSPTGVSPTGRTYPLFIVKVPSRGMFTFRCADPATRESWANALADAVSLAIDETAEEKQRQENVQARAAGENHLESVSMKLAVEETAKLADSELETLETAMEGHNQRAQLIAVRAEQAGNELRKAERLTKHVELIREVVTSEGRSRAAIDSAEGSARSAADRLRSQEERRRSELKSLEEEHVALLATQLEEKADLNAQLAAAKAATAKANSNVNVALAMVELRNEQLAGLETLLTTKEHDRAVLMATLEGQEGSLLASAQTKKPYEAELEAMISAAAELTAEVTNMQHAERTAKLLAVSKQERLVAAKGAGVDFAGVMATQCTSDDDPTHAPSVYREQAGQVSDALSAQLESAIAMDVAREKQSVVEISRLKAKVAASQTAIGIKRSLVDDLLEAHNALAEEVACSEVAVSAAVDLCEALKVQRTFIEEELANLNETLIRERAASAQAKKATERLCADVKAQVLLHEEGVAGSNALLDEERARVAVLAEKRAPAFLPPAAVVCVSIAKDTHQSTGSDAEDVPLTSFFTGAVEEVDARLATLAEMREAVVRDHEADAKQLAAAATQLMGTEALVAAENASEARARAALQKYEAALN